MDWDLGIFFTFIKVIVIFFKKTKRCEKSLHYVKEKNCELCTDFEFKMIHVMELLLWSAMLAQVKRKSLPGKWSRIISVWSIILLLLLHHRPTSTSFPDSTLHPEVFPAPGTREGTFRVVQFTLNASTGDYKEYLICLFLFASSLSLRVLWTIMKL